MEILDYESGKWKDVYNSDGKKSIVFDISGKNCGIGVGTEKPFSRISMGNNNGDGTNTNLAALGIHELVDGKDFHGISYITDISSNDVLSTGTNTTTNALAYANPLQQLWI